MNRFWEIKFGPQSIYISISLSIPLWVSVSSNSVLKGIFIPPLPKKSVVKKFRFSAEFIEMRHQGLDIFVNRVASHHKLQQSEDLRTFLQADEDMMERLRSQETGIFKKKSSDLMQTMVDVKTKVSDVVLGKEKPVKESNPEYEKLKHYVFELEQSLSDFGKAAKLLGACEGNALGKAFTDLGTKSKLLSIKLQKEAQKLLMNFEEPLKDYVRAVQSIKDTIAERANAFKQQCELVETIKLKEINLYVYGNLLSLFFFFVFFFFFFLNKLSLNREEMSTYYLEHAGVHHLQKQFDLFEEKARSLLAFGLAIPA
ncbi:hypothetical protein UlMin_036931 [Ulmus minor]